MKIDLIYFNNYFISITNYKWKAENRFDNFSGIVTLKEMQYLKVVKSNQRRNIYLIHFINKLLELISLK
jgi:hypothetical protein